MGNNNYCVYKHTTPSNKVYIGITNQGVDGRWGNNGEHYRSQVFGRAIAKYGWENIQHDVLFTGLTKSEAEKKERELITQYNATDSSFGYNCTSGGSTYSFNEETKKRISEALTGRKLSEEHKANIGKSKIGHPVSEETREKIGDKHRNKVVDDVAREHIRAAHEWQTKPVIMLSMGNKPIKIFQSVGDAARTVGCSKLLIRRVCQGKRKSTNGYRWAFYEGGEDIAERS